MANLVANYPDLNKMFGDFSMLPSQLGMQQWDQAQQNEQANYLGALQDLAFNEQMNPLKVTRAGLENQGLEAELPGKRASSSLLEDQANVSRNTLGLQLDARSRELLDSISDSEVKQIENMFQKMAYSNDPQQRMLGAQGLEFSKTVLQEKSKQKYMSDRQMELERLRGKNNKEVEQMRIDAGKYNKKGQLSMSIQDMLTSGKLNYEKAAVLLNNAAVAAEMEGDAERALIYRNMASEYAAKNEAARAAAGAQPRAGSADLERLDIPATPSRPTVPFSDPTKKPETPRATDQVSIGSPETYKKAFGAYEPDKYDYRMGPGGVPQRKLKGK